ncbi:D-alanyl-D-alanine carboxypeptidase [Streptomyces sp. NPDC126499]|uniref:D-alanyl-D-alanine carboxypeptidase family protein n=1 Tax=Streptomyces sp. NPDC126499 TaxID=3155314 RepID=UPI003319F981
MSDGGGTVAGESPDKSEQRESAVGGDGKDPRLSVLQGRVDEPTAVFKALAPRTAPEDAPSASEPSVTKPSATEDAEEDAGETAAVAEEPETESESGSGSEAAAAAGAGGETGETDGETGGEGERLRDAVAAWVSTSGDAEQPTAEQPAAEKPEAEKPEAEKPEAETVAEAASGADGEGGAGAGADADADAGRAGAWFAARKPAGAASEPKPKPEPETAPEAKQPEPEPEAVPEVKQSEPAAEPAEAPESRPVDQPTAVFKALKPPAEPAAPAGPAQPGQPAGPAQPARPAAPAGPPVDQPTTALKLPQSTFRPLRGDITQEQPKPAPASAPRPAAAAGPVPPPSLSEPERTRQQPLPPRPPLEILAELTNTPPPPETPLRNTVRRVKIWTPLVLLLLIVFAVVQFVRPLPEPKLVLSAAPTYTFAGGELRMPWPSEGQGAAEVEGVGSLGTYGPQKPAPIASVAKTMTAYVILRDHPIKGKQEGPQIAVDKTAGEQAKAKDESTAQIKEGQTYSQKELLQLLMIPSGNNVARLLARWDAGSEAAFVEKMNAAAKELGMTDSTYTDPSGLQSTTVSTPLDQLKLARAVMQYDVFRQIVDTPDIVIDGIPNKIINNNSILLEPGVTGIKTGSSTPAGGNLLWAANTVVDGEKRRILGIVMGAKDAPELWQKLELAIQNSLKLIQKAQADVTSAAVVKKGEVVGYIDDGLGGRTPVVSTKDLKAVGWPGLKVDLRLGGTGKALPHTGKAGDVVGEVSIGTGTGRVSAPVALKNDLAEPGFDKKLTRLG